MAVSQARQKKPSTNQARKNMEAKEEGFEVDFYLGLQELKHPMWEFSLVFLHSSWKQYEKNKVFWCGDINPNRLAFDPRFEEHCSVSRIEKTNRNDILRSQVLTI